MKRKTSSLPTRVYSYGALAPIEAEKAYEEQLFRAHRYRNALCEIERARRAEIAAAQCSHDKLGPVLATIECVEAFIAETRSEIKRARAHQCGRAEELALREQVESALSDLAVLRFIRGACKLANKHDEVLLAEYQAADEQAKSKVRALRAGDEAPHWGTYLTLEEAARKWRSNPEPPRFVRYDGQGRVAVQTQKGLDVAAALAGEDTRLRIMPGTLSAKQIEKGVCVKESYRTLWIRIGSDKRAPVWAKFPFVMHRPLPANGRIMWAWVKRMRLGVRYRYEVQFVLEATNEAFEGTKSRKPELPPVPDATVAVDVGQRELLPEEDLRVAAWRDWIGRTGTLELPRTRRSSPSSHGQGRRREVPCALDKVDDLQSIRDKYFDEILPEVIVYKLRSKTSMPTELLARMQSMANWRSPARIGALRRDWAQQWRHGGDDEILALMTKYLARDRHLVDWQSNERRRHHARRKNLYRVFAARVAAQYETILLVDRDYRRAKRSPENATDSEGHESRVVMRKAAPGSLRDAIVAAAEARGRKVLYLEIEGDTSWTVDAHRVCERMLASAGDVCATAQPLAGVTMHETTQKASGARVRQLGTRKRIDPLAGVDVAPRSSKDI